MFILDDGLDEGEWGHNIVLLMSEVDQLEN